MTVLPVLQNITTVSVRLRDVNDNAPEFRFSSYVSSILLKDAAAGKLLLTLEATDRDAGDNALITYRSALEPWQTGASSSTPPSSSLL